MKLKLPTSLPDPEFPCSLNYRLRLRPKRRESDNPPFKPRKPLRNAASTAPHVSPGDSGIGPD